jgi:hypothetical protein
MSSPASNLRQRSGKATQPSAAATPEQQQANCQDELTTMDKFNFYFAQHIGLVVSGIGIALLSFGYDKGWMHNTHLCLLCLAFCLVGLFFHEFRPYNVSKARHRAMSSQAAFEDSHDRLCAVHDCLWIMHTHAAQHFPCLALTNVSTSCSASPHMTTLLRHPMQASLFSTAAWPSSPCSLPPA